jgi:uncharacterized damage-inducible protein DinB
MLAEALKRQFNNAFDVLASAIPSFKPEDWRRGSPPYNGPARAVRHVLECAEFYTCRDETIWTRLGKPVWKMTDEELPSQEQMLSYLTEARAKTMAWIDALGDAGLAAAGTTDGVVNGLEQVVYALRHLQHHTGEVCAYQKQCGLEPAPWK